MKIVVCVKQVPDSSAKVVVENGVVSWGDAPLVVNPWDEFALEAALVQKDEQGADVVALSLGEEGSLASLKQAIAMGCTEAVLVSDPALKNADSQAAARVLAAAIQKIGGVDLAIFGKQAIDADTGVTASQAARVLGWPALTLVSVVKSLDSSAVEVERSIEEGRQVVKAPLPAVLSVSKDIGEPRIASFMGIRKAQKAAIPIWSLADLGIAAPQPVVSWPEVLNPPLRQVTSEMVTGSSPQEIAEQLVDKILAEKVL